MATEPDQDPVERLTTQALAALFQLKLSGADLEIESLQALDEAEAGSLAICLDRAHLSEALGSRASALVCAEPLEAALSEVGWGQRGDALLVAPAQRETVAHLALAAALEV